MLQYPVIRIYDSVHLQLVLNQLVIVKEVIN